MSSVVEGWYVDPSTGTNLRFWNGVTWTDEVSPLPDAPPNSPHRAAVPASIFASSDTDGSRAPRHGADVSDSDGTPSPGRPRHAE